jgi:hypothetical protein
MVRFTLLLFFPEETTPDKHWIRSWVGPRASLEAVDKRNIVPCWELNPTYPALIDIN